MPPIPRRQWRLNGRPDPDEIVGESEARLAGRLIRTLRRKGYRTFRRIPSGVIAGGLDSRIMVFDGVVVLRDYLPVQDEWRLSAFVMA